MEKRSGASDHLGMIDGDQTVLQEDRSTSAGSATPRLRWPDILCTSSLRQEWHAEYEEILRHKWIESEKAGHDIGWDLALVDWSLKHRYRWPKGRQGQERAEGDDTD